MVPPTCKPTALPTRRGRRRGFAGCPLEERSMPVQVLYTTAATATGGRDGHAETADGAFRVDLARPKELGGTGGAGNNPEQLFASGYAACFLGAMQFVAAQGGPKVPPDAKVKATVGIGPR